MYSRVKYKLSICIPTLNRGGYIGQTLESIISQIESGVEVVIVDGGSIDETEKIVNQYQASFAFISYIRRNEVTKGPSNEGFDRDCNHSIELASGDYCWIMTDDDLLKPGAIKKILAEIERGYDLIVASIEIRDHDVRDLLLKKRPFVKLDKVYAPSEWNSFFIDVSKHLTYAGAVIIKRTLWLSRDREKYYGSGYIHLGVIYDEPIRGKILVIACPLITIRYNNEHWTDRAFQIQMVSWPNLVSSFSSLSEEARRAVCRKEPWRDWGKLLLQRAYGTYSVREYQLFLERRLRNKREKVLAKAIAKIPRIALYIPGWLYSNAIFSKRKLLLAKLNNSWKKRPN